MKKRLALVLIVLLAVVAVPLGTTAKAESNAQDDLNDHIDDVVDKLDTSELEKFLQSLDSDTLSFLGITDVGSYIKNVIAGNTPTDFKSILQLLLSLLGANFLKCLPLILAVLAVAIAFNVINSLKGSFASDSVEEIVHFACIGVIVILLSVRLTSIISSAATLIASVKKQVDIVFPIMLTLMSAAGAGASVGVYQPAVAVLSAGIIGIVSSFAVPAFILSVAFAAVGNLSGGVKLKEMAGFFMSLTKWLLSTAFFLFMTFLSVRGITASVYDNISVRTTKFALSKYVPVIGGYLSEGFNLVMAGSILVKNSVGLLAIVLLLATVLPFVLNITVFGLSLKLAAAVTEPLGNSRITGLLTGVSKSLGILTAVILGLAFLYFVFVILVIGTGNLAL